jgi:acetyl-CoA carboxylase biotin carboxyl carrier protein
VSETVDPRDRNDLRALLRAIEDGGWEYARVEIGGVSLVVSHDADFVGLDPSGTPSQNASPAPATNGQHPPAPTAVSAPNPSPAGMEPSAPSDATVSGDPDVVVLTVTAPSIGLFWRSPKPGAPPFVEVGDHVEAGDTVCIIEVMKLMTHVTAGVSGVVRAIHVANGDMVEHGTALVDVEPIQADR